MGVTVRPNGLEHTASGDTSTGNYKVRFLHWDGISNAADDLIVKNGAGEVIGHFHGGADLFQHIEWPFGPYFVKGIETDTLDSGDVEYVFE